MNPALKQIIEGLVEYRKLYAKLLRYKDQTDRDKRVLRKKYTRFKKAIALLNPILGER